MMISRNDLPSRASMSDLGCWSPIVVARPPLSLITTTRDSARCASAAGRSASAGTSPAGSSSALGSIAVSPDSSRS